jgi:hypothetical protein
MFKACGRRTSVLPKMLAEEPKAARPASTALLVAWRLLPRSLAAAGASGSWHGVRGSCPAGRVVQTIGAQQSGVVDVERFARE